MRVFIANFGRENYEWPRCLERNTIATMNSEEVHAFWERGEREAYIDYCIRNLKTAAGITPTRPVASRWFNLMTIVAETSGDVWIHREKEILWWTVSRAAAPTFEIEDDPKPLAGGSARVYVCHKSCEPWSSKNKAGNRLEWTGLHPRAREFLFTEGTLQQLSDDNAAYARALIDADDLNVWHSRSDWKEKSLTVGNGPGTAYNARQKSVWEIANQVVSTADNSKGQKALTTIKNKELRMSKEELIQYVNSLIDSQDGLCALTGIKFQFRGEHDDDDLLCSLDRIDSDGHYEKGNLQVVCRFINRWKSNDDNANFKRLIDQVRSSV